MLDFFYDKETSKSLDLLLEFIPKALTFVAILVIGFWLVSKLMHYVNVLMVRRNLDMSVRGFLKDIIHIILNVLVVLLAVNNLGIEITSVLALIGGAALGLGMGLQGGLSNFAGGVMIIITKPFKVGDLINTQNQTGYVERIDMFNTTLRTVQNEVVVLPNAPIFNSTVTNYSAKGTVRTDVTVGIEYDCDHKKLSQLIREAIRKQPFFSDEYPIIIGIEAFDDSSIRLCVRAYAKVVDFWEAPLKLNQIIKETMDQHGYTIPFPQRDLNIKHNSQSKQEPWKQSETFNT